MTGHHHVRAQGGGDESMNLDIRPDDTKAGRAADGDDAGLGGIALRLTRAARILGHAIAQGINAHDADMASAEQRLQASIDRVGSTIQPLIEAVGAWASRAAARPRGDVDQALLDAYRATREAMRTAEEGPP
jgi:hypothetical protein